MEGIHKKVVEVEIRREELKFFERPNVFHFETSVSYIFICPYQWDGSKLQTKDLFLIPLIWWDWFIHMKFLLFLSSNEENARARLIRRANHFVATFHSKSFIFSLLSFNIKIRKRTILQEKRRENAMKESSLGQVKSMNIVWLWFVVRIKRGSKNLKVKCLILNSIFVI